MKVVESHNYLISYLCLEINETDVQKSYESC